jgi:ABC-type branched-subunit amino acid transport system substrate-binding protein
VFAVLSGISASDWQPIHDFCEDKRLPCLFPVTDFPGKSENDWYTFYFNKGYAQEGEAAATYLYRQNLLSVVQVVQDSRAGRALAEGFSRKWHEFDLPEPETIILPSDKLRLPDAIDSILKTKSPEVLLLWTGIDPILLLSSKANAIGTLFVSSRFLGSSTLRIPDAIRDKTLLTYPFRLTPYVGPKSGGHDAKIPVLATYKDFGNERISSRVLWSVQQVVLNGMGLLYENYYRDYLIDVISMMMDTVVKDYERISFGPGQRFVSKGCYVIQLGPGEEPQLIPRSEWVVQ